LSRFPWMVTCTAHSDTCDNERSYLSARKKIMELSVWDRITCFVNATLQRSYHIYLDSARNKALHDRHPKQRQYMLLK
jgi:hypothetical protein